MKMFLLQLSPLTISCSAIVSGEHSSLNNNVHPLSLPCPPSANACSQFAQQFPLSTTEPYWCAWMKMVLLQHRYFRLCKQDWKRVHVHTINTSTPCWNRNEHIDHAHLISSSIAHMKLALWQQAYLDAS